MAAAATYVVAPNGSNANPGTLERPFATIAFGVSKLAAAGDTLVVRGGTYRESITVWRKHGAAGRPITISAQRGEKPVIDGSGTRSNAVVSITSSSFITLDAFEVRNGPHAGVLVYESQNIAVRWNDVHDCQTHGIGILSDRRGATHDVLVEGNIVKRCVLSNFSGRARHGWQQALSANGCSRVTIVKNYVHENFGEGIDYILSDGGTIAHNQLWDNFSVNIYLDNARNTLVDANFITTGWARNPAQHFRGGLPAGGIDTANERYKFQRPLDALSIINNVVIGTSSGFRYRDAEFGGGLHHTVIANNTFVMTGQAVMIEPSRHDTTTIANNIFEQRADSLPPEAPSSGIAFRTNAWHGGRGVIRGTNDVNADPQFVNTHSGTADGFRLRASSPLRGAATPLPSVKTDFTGALRRANTIGAFDS
jgi:hypothetical protein